MQTLRDSQIRQVSSPTVVLRNVSKTYKLTSAGSEIGLGAKRRANWVHALRKTSLVIEKGESVGILGRNGSGKSTLLSLMAGHIRPTAGEVLVSSQPTLLSVGAVLQGHLTGYQNVRLGLLAKGAPVDKIDTLAEKAIEWADIGAAISRPLQTYSSGQRARLKFAIATSVRPEILLVDEALSTGDSAFAYKAKLRMREFLSEASTVVLVSHAPNTIEEHCKRAIWVHEGSVIADGPVRHVNYHYKNWTHLCAHPDPAHAPRYIRKLRADFEPPEINLS